MNMICARRMGEAVLLLSALLAGTALAVEGGLPGDDNKPFAEDRIVLQLSESGDSAQRLVLSIASNLIGHYGGPDLVDIEIVAFGPGIALMFADNQNAERISSLVANGVRFVGCMNTVETIARREGKAPKLNPDMIPVKTGVAHIIQRVKAGFIVIRP
jgi:intracellular sulfur oxidation DsrE/DsrF family protein